jgi:hypothetical protein
LLWSGVLTEGTINTSSSSLEEQGLYYLDYTVTGAQVIVLSVKLGGQDIVDSPFQNIEVLPSSVQAMKSELLN